MSSQQTLIACILALLLGVTLALPLSSLDESSKFAELEETIRKLSSSIMQMSGGDTAQDMLNGFQGDYANENNFMH